jgi:hypothetical protein
VIGHHAEFCNRTSPAPHARRFAGLAGAAASMLGLLIGVAGGSLVLSLEPVLVATGLALLAGGIYLVHVGQRPSPGVKESPVAPALPVHPEGLWPTPRRPEGPIEQMLWVLLLLGD